SWAKSVPEGFRFALKANQQITHIQRLRGSESTLKRFLEVASVLQEGDHLGPILVQLPPTFKFDKPLLEDFLALRPPAFLFAFEVRHASWYTDETYAVDRKSTRLNSSHVAISYAVFCLKKKTGDVLGLPTCRNQ